jgi:hypothetical protein
VRGVGIWSGWSVLLSSEYPFTDGIVQETYIVASLGRDKIQDVVCVASTASATVIALVE